MSRAAAERSVLNAAGNDVLRNIGLNYPIQEKVNQVFPNSKGENKSILELIQDGARFEDNSLRPINHFLDPLSGDALLPLIAKPSPSWALEDKGSIIFPLWQHYSFADARDYLYKALTLPDKEERKKNVGRTFESLGRVIHHIQDMAQPQHVRLDAHLKLSDADKPDWFFEKGSRFETYTLGLGGNLPFTGYPPVTFDTARKFWTGKDQGIADFTNQNFLSAGTNFDAGKSATLPTPLRAKDYPKPEWNRQIQTRTWAELLAEDGISCNPNPLPGGGGGCGIECTGLPPQNAPPACLLSGEMDFYATNVVDHYNPAASGTNPRASTLSIFDQDLVNTGKRQFALNRFNFQAAYPFLIPKAVAYSAGLIDDFFRGRLAINDVSDDDTRLFIEVKNVSGPKNDFSRGRFEVYYDAVDGTRKPLMVTQNATTGLAVDGRLELTATKPKLSDVDLSKDNPLTLVYRGRIGAEEGIATTVLEMPLSGFVVSPSPLAAGNPRNHVYFEDGTWRVSPYAGLAAGNIDWKGSINGHTKVLSWLGSKGRNLPDWTDFQKGAQPQPSPYIFQNGRVLAVAPAPVLGAALTRDSQGDIWLVAIVYDDIVYRRPAKRTASTLFDPTNPTAGWTEVGRFPHDDNFRSPDRPWFFNASGTQAQTMRLANKTLTQVLNGVASQAAVRRSGSALYRTPGRQGGEYPEPRQSRRLSHQFAMPGHDLG